MDIREYLKSGKLLFFDGALGTELQKRGLCAGEMSESIIFSDFETLVALHMSYIEAGANVITANTFGCNDIKLQKFPHSCEETVNLALKACHEARKRSGREVFIALDIGSTGKLLEPLGELSFDRAYDAFAKQAILGEKAGADIAVIETFTDPYEMKAAVLAVKENTVLPVFATFSFEENGRILTGADVKCAVALLEGLGVDALGINCGFGPDKMKGIISEFLKYSSIPVMVQANAGLPEVSQGETKYSIDADCFANYALEFALKGVKIIGGCCGTDPDYIRACIKKTSGIEPVRYENAEKRKIISGLSEALEIGADDYRVSSIILEPLKSDIDTLINQAFSASDEGANVLRINVDCENDEDCGKIIEALKTIQSMFFIPLSLQLSMSENKYFCKILRYYNGNPMLEVFSQTTYVKETTARFGGVIVGKY